MPLLCIIRFFFLLRRYSEATYIRQDHIGYVCKIFFIFVNFLGTVKGVVTRTWICKFSNISRQMLKA